MKRLLLLLTILLFAAFLALAQDSNYAACEDLAERISSIQESAAALDPSSAELSQEIAALQTQITIIDTECRGLSFSSEIDGSQPVLGPIILEEGVYRATLTTEGFAIINGTELDGDCERELRLFSIGRGDAANGAQAVINLEDDCEFLLEFSNITDAWAFTIEKLR